jgi:hypothetical protein
MSDEGDNELCPHCHGDGWGLVGVDWDCEDGINGPYDRTAELSGGYAVYAKRGDGSVCIEHRAGKWRVKHVSDKGKDLSYAFISGNRALEDCASCVWSVWDGPADVDLLFILGNNLTCDTMLCVTCDPHSTAPFFHCKSTAVRFVY